MPAPARPVTPRRRCKPSWKSVPQNSRDSDAQACYTDPVGDPERTEMGMEGRAPILGLMQDWPLTTDKFIDHARRWHPKREIVSRLCDGRIERRNYAEMHRDAKRLSTALVAHGI